MRGTNVQDILKELNVFCFVVYTQIREVDRSRPLISPGPALSDIHTFGTVDVGQLRNIRVIAKVGYTARADGELSFKKGEQSCSFFHIPAIAHRWAASY